MLILASLLTGNSKKNDKCLNNSVSKISLFKFNFYSVVMYYIVSKINKSYYTITASRKHLLLTCNLAVKTTNAKSKTQLMLITIHK